MGSQKLIRNTSRSTQNSAKLFEDASKYSPRGVHGEGKFYEPFPVYMRRAKGSRIWDVDGNEYIDFWMGAGPNLLGHANSEVDRAVVESLAEHGPLFGAPHEWGYLLAKRISELVPSAEMSAFACGGSDALCYAVRTARTYTGRSKILKFEGSYHGWYDGLLFNVSPNLDAAGADDAPNKVPLSDGLPPEAAEHITILPYNNEELVERLFEKEGNQYACIVVEPVMHGGGTACVEPKAGYLQFLRDICDRYGVLLVFDEILTGFRHDLGGAQKLMGVVPDLTAFGKALSNGYPICSLSGKREYMKHVAPEGGAYFSGTYNGNVLCVRAALKTLEVLEKTNAHEKLWKLGNQFVEEVNKRIETLNIDARAKHYGPMACVHFSKKEMHNYRDVARNHDIKKNRAFFDWMSDRGIFNRPRHVVGFRISAAHTEEDISRTTELIGGFFTEHQTSLR